MLLTDQKAQYKPDLRQQDQPKTKLKATWVVENKQLVCSWSAS